MKGICSRHIHGYWYFVLICAGLFVYSEHFFFCDLLLLLLCAINKLFLLQFLINNNLYSILPYHSCSEFIHRSLGRRLSTFNSIRVTLVCCYYFMVERSIFPHYLQLMLIFSYFAFSSFSLPLPLSLCRSLSAALPPPLSLSHFHAYLFSHLRALSPVYCLPRPVVLILLSLAALPPKEKESAFVRRSALTSIGLHRHSLIPDWKTWQTHACCTLLVFSLLSV